MQDQHSEAAKFLETNLNKANFTFFLRERLRVLEQVVADAKLRSDPNVPPNPNKEYWILQGQIVEINYMLILVNRSSGGL